MDGRRNFPPDPDGDPRWYPDDRGYDDRGRDDRRDDLVGDDRSRDDRAWDDRGRDDRSRDERGPDDRGYTPTRYADDRDRDDGYRVPEPRTSGRGYGGDVPGYGDSPSGQFSAPSRTGDVMSGFVGDSGEFTGESVSRSRRSEAIDRSALQRPVSGGPSAAPAQAGPVGMPGPLTGPNQLGPSGSLGGGTGPVTVPTQPAGGGRPPSSGGPGGHGGAGGAPPSAFVAPTTLTAAIPAPSASAAADPGGAVYRSKRPGLATALVLLTVLFEVPVLRLFFDAMTADKIAANGTLASIFMILGLPMFGLGLYGLIGGAAAAAPGARAWLRTPLAYLPVALLLFIAAALSS